MAESLNTKCDLVVKGISYLGLNNYGKIMVGDKAFEFYNDRNVNDYIQIPWEEIDYIVADVLFGGRWIPRFAIETKKNGSYRFGASKNTKALLRACRNHFPANRMVKARSAADNVYHGVKRLLKRDKMV